MTMRERIRKHDDAHRPMGGRPAGVTHEFTSVEACETALTQARKVWGSSTYGFCTPK